MTDREKVFSDAAKIFRKDVDELSDETRLIEDLNAMSSQLIALATTVEDIADADVGFGSIRKCATLGDVVSLAERLK